MTSVQELPIARLTERIRADLGEESVSLDPVRLERASVDWAQMSPILKAKLPAGRADLVVTPRSADEIPIVLRHCYEMGVPVTPRGTGLGNYGQAIPLQGGLVLDVSRCRTLVKIEDGVVTAEAGIRMRDLDNAVRQTGQELPIFPSTKGSTLGGFLAGGSGGTGSLIHGTNADGFVKALDVAVCDGSGMLRKVTGSATLPYVHAYGTTGIIARATVGLTPAYDWVGFFTAWPDYSSAADFLCSLRSVSPSPRLASLDEAPIVAALPADTALDPTRLSVRVIARAETIDELRRRVADGGGEVLAVREGPNGADRVSSLSFNHSTFHLQRKEPGYFHLEVAGELLWTSPGSVRAVFPETLLHLELMKTQVVGMLMARYESPEQVYDGMAQLAAMGVSIHSPHTWILERRIDGVRAVLAENDPRGLLNPGKLAL
ncbi:FAD-binding oxidoreductase [Amycolatopsis rhizosphaerae]|uniref:FAD-binding oxidoreductase n=1 Tax=Amycolatopsis rhizosphaerae TaxID=2053003 RepID=A0A558DPK7_9PSEU|nr:FAD-binding oxidoreductase [Amycolatopsis rhizosphaerae]TVT62883.1 FAD-binding oxidoreductase [Amycolatopsis rhizosphaerae]